jgi:hypothetical protein
VSRTREQRAAIAKDAAQRVYRATGTRPELSYTWILWALEDADHAEPVASWSTGRMYAECVAIPVVALALGAVLLWCWP